MPKRLLRIAIACAFGLLVAAGIARWQYEQSRPPAASSARVGGPFTLVDHTGRTVTDADFRGKHLLIYFGYTYCPDVCPTELQAMAQALDRLGGAADRIQPLFITIDPARDTPELLAGYVGMFHPDLVGLTGTPEQIRETAGAYKVYHAKAEGQDPDGYLMDHSSVVYLMGPDGRFVDLFSHGTSAEEMAARIEGHLGL